MLAIVIVFLLVIIAASTILAHCQAVSTKPCLRWEVAEGKSPNRAQVERLYLASCRWVEAEISPRRSPLRPCVTVVVGKRCPAEKYASCADLIERRIYLERWDESSTGHIVQGFLRIAILDLLPEEERKAVAQRLLDLDAKNFVDVKPE